MKKYDFYPFEKEKCFAPKTAVDPRRHQTITKKLKRILPQERELKKRWKGCGVIFSNFS